MSGADREPTPETGQAERLIAEARATSDLAARQMKLLEAEILLEEQQLKFLGRLERATVRLEWDSRWLVVLTVALLVEAVGEAFVFYLIR